jgi:hypothetical protein
MSASEMNSGIPGESTLPLPQKRESQSHIEAKESQRYELATIHPEPHDWADLNLETRFGMSSTENCL